MTADRLEAENQANELREEVASLLEELRSVNSKYEEAVEDREKERRGRETAEEEVRSWKKQYEQTKTQLRNVKGACEGILQLSASLAAAYIRNVLDWQPLLKFSHRTSNSRASICQLVPMASSPTFTCLLSRRLLTTSYRLHGKLRRLSSTPFKTLTRMQPSTEQRNRLLSCLLPESLSQPSRKSIVTSNQSILDSSPLCLQLIRIF